MLYDPGTEPGLVVCCDDGAGGPVVNRKAVVVIHAPQLGRSGKDSKFRSKSGDL